jgi:crotonobetainyl-CoA:carnitine CoA-transferase CaiB-like acyl-CoA transferase
MPKMGWECDLAMGALGGRRVLEVGDESGMYCGKLLADLGAEVVRIEPPGGDPARFFPPLARDERGDAQSLSFLYLNTNKRSLVLDLETDEGAESFRRLAAEADIVIESLAPGTMDALGLGNEVLRSSNAGLVYTSVSSFGQSGPHRAYAGSDLVVSAMAGGMVVTGEAEDPPVVLAGSQAHVMASTCAAAASLIALRHRDRTGRGQWVDISGQEVMTAVTHVCGIGKYLDDGIVPKRNGTGLFASVPSGAYACRDGFVYLMVNRPLHWKALAEWIHERTGNEEVLDPMFEGPSSVRIEYRELLDIFISDLTKKYDVNEIYHEGQRRHIAITPVNRVLDVARDPHLAARRFFQPVEQADGSRITMPGAPYRLSATPWRIRRPAPLPGQEAPADVEGEPESAREPHRKSTEGAKAAAGQGGALAGLKVVEFTAGMAGPWIGRFMAFCGAEVIKVESRKHPSVVRLYIPPRERELGIQPALSPWFTDWDAGKRFISLDLAEPEAVRLAKKLVARADVVIENYSTGVMEKLGLGYEVLKEAQPELIHLSTTGYGDSGPNASYVTWGSNIEAISGLSALTGFPERDCAFTQFAYPDALSALHGLVAVMAALDHRRRSGIGQHISLSQFEATVASAGSAMMEALAVGREPERLGNRSRRMAPHGSYPCAGEDRWCVISVGDEAAWRRLCRVAGHPEWAEDERFAGVAARLRNQDALDELVAGWSRAHEREALMEMLQAGGVAAGVVQDVDDLLHRDRHLAARGFFEEISHRVKGKVRATGIPLGLTGTPGSSWRAGADYGEDNHEVFGELLGMSETEIRRLEEIGVIERKP